MDDELFMGAPEEQKSEQTQTHKSITDMIVHMKPEDLFTDHF